MTSHHIIGRRRAELLESGIDDAGLRRAVRRGETTRLARGIYAPSTGAAPTASARATGILEAVTADGSHAASHRTAAELLQLPLSSESARLLNISPRSLEISEPLEVATTDGRKAIRRPGILLGHRAQIAQERLTRVGEIVTTDHSRTWADLAALLTVEELVVLADQL
ncbi:MAG: type IV toxin-antitoxin system AbiEi family antitoxin domain-containing protein, partial [Nesterenkonia sp.]|nr:type IV toxin-antitoxin system AbiEi family antitoxin domain-containing protein [Nesterenkonia sp.]